MKTTWLTLFVLGTPALHAAIHAPKRASMTHYSLVNKEDWSYPLILLLITVTPKSAFLTELRHIPSRSERKERIWPQPARPPFLLLPPGFF
jgi:hypothetical protein